MKKTAIFWSVLFLLFLSFGISSCQSDREEPFPSETEQTLFMYMPWSNNLTDYFKQNLADFETVIKKNLLKNNRVIVFFSSSPTQATLFEMKYHKGNSIRKTIKEYENIPFTTAAGITSILNDVIAFAPANRYAMTVSCHGMG